MELTSEESKITIRTASNFGFKLATNLGVNLDKENVLPSNWPMKFPITLKQVLKIPEINKDNRIARKVIDAAKVMWQNIREAALEVEKDMMLHPEYYELVYLDEIEQYGWRELSVDIEQIAGNIFATEFDDEDSAKKNVYKLLSTRNLKKYMLEFDDDYKNFMNEAREAIRNKKEILASARLEMIGMLNVNTQAARKILDKKKAI